MDTKTIVGLVLIAALLSFGGGWAARRGGPAQVTEHTVETRLKDTIINNTYKVDVAELNRLIADQFAKLQKNIKVDQTVEKRPDGTEVTHTVTTDNSTSESGSHTDSSSSTHTAASGTGSSSEHQLQVDDRFKQVAGSGPRWAFGAFATYQPFGAAPTYSLLPNERLTIAVTAERRFWGPIWVGGVLTSNLAVGGGLKLVF